MMVGGVFAGPRGLDGVFPEGGLSFGRSSAAFGDQSHDFGDLVRKRGKQKIENFTIESASWAEILAADPGLQGLTAARLHADELEVEDDFIVPGQRLGLELSFGDEVERWRGESLQWSQFGWNGYDDAASLIIYARAQRDLGDPPAIVPEVGSLALLTAGLSAFVARRARSKKSEGRG